MTGTGEAVRHTATETMLSLEGVDVAIDRDPILRGVDLEIRRGEMVALVGRNGAGKTTTLRSIMGLLELQGGRIVLDGADISAAPAHQRVRMGMGYMPEDRRLIPRFTVEENILMPTWVAPPDDTRQRLAEVYDLIPEVAAFAGRQALSLSGGQQKLVALGRALLVGRRVLLLDEPFEGVAPALAQRLNEIMARLSSSKERTVLVCDSSLGETDAFYDRHVFIERGQITLR